MRWTVVPNVRAPSAASCCHDGKGFFCSSHRRLTLTAQYRYLPALALVKRTEPFASGRTQWVVLVDDDSYVFVRRLRRLLSGYRSTQPLMLGEFRGDNAYACGGAGAVLSRAALLHLDLATCIARTRRRCLQSDWQLGECVRAARRPAIHLDARHGCGTCAATSRNGSDRYAGAPPAGCHFMQEAEPHARWLLATAAGGGNRSHRVRSPSIVHGAKVAAALSLGARRRRGWAR